MFIMSDDFVSEVAWPIFDQYDCSDGSPTSRKQIKEALIAPFPLGYFLGYCEANVRMIFPDRSQMEELYIRVCSMFDIPNLKAKFDKIFESINDDDLAAEFADGRSAGLCDAFNFALDVQTVIDKGEATNNLQRYLLGQPLVFKQIDLDDDLYGGRLVEAVMNRAMKEVHSQK